MLLLLLLLIKAFHSECLRSIEKDCVKRVSILSLLVVIMRDRGLLRLEKARI